MPEPSRGELWLADLNPARGHEQAGRRPCLIVSEDVFNAGPSGLAIVVPLTARAKGIPLHVQVAPPEGGLTALSFVKCEDIRSISKERLVRRLGAVSPTTMRSVEYIIRVLMGL